VVQEKHTDKTRQLKRTIGLAKGVVAVGAAFYLIRRRLWLLSCSCVGEIFCGVGDEEKDSVLFGVVGAMGKVGIQPRSSTSNKIKAIRLMRLILFHP